VDRVRSGIIGAGFAGTAHARAVRAAGGVVAVVASATAASASGAARRLQAERAAVQPLDVITADDVDLVHICTPNHAHAELAERALAAGKHVICEKPLATGSAAAERMMSLAAAAGTVTAVPFVYRFYPMAREARARVRRGDCGPLRLLHGTYLQDWLASTTDNNWRVDPRLGGLSRAFGDIGVHWCDLVEFITRHRITRLSARTLVAHPQRRSGRQPVAVQTEDAATVMFETDQGALGSLVISQVSPGHKNRLWFSLDGAAASLSFDQQAPDSLWVGSQADSRSVTRGAATQAPEAAVYSILPPGHPQGYQDCFNAFVADVHAAIGGRVPDGLPTFADGMRAATLTAAVLESAAAQTWTEVPS
jgi:predicted dehydrogenase